jgi:hypothetical protein
VIRIERAAGRAKTRDFIRFASSVNRGERAWVDTARYQLETFLRNGDSFVRRCSVEPVAAVEGGRTLAQAVLITHPEFPLLQLGFFEALPHQDEAVDALLSRARELARERGFPRIVIGLNGHVAYGVGIQTEGFAEKASFDSLWNPPWYADYLERRGLESRELVSWASDTASLARLFNGPSARRLEGPDWSFRTMDFRRFREECLLFGELCNRCLADTPLYFYREPESLYELLRALRPFLRPRHLRFALFRGESVGFLFWHPDWNEVLPAGRPVSTAEAALRFALLAKRIGRVKINAIGVAPEHQGGSAAYGLIRSAWKDFSREFARGETNFVWAENAKSMAINRAINQRVMRRWRVYFMDADERASAGSAGERGSP